MAVFTKAYEQDLKKNLNVHMGNDNVFSADNDSTVLNVSLYENGEAAILTGSVVVYAIRADGNTVTFSGTRTNNVVSATLPQSCFAVPGRLEVMLQIVSGDVKTTVFKGVFRVVASKTGSIIDPGTVVPDISDLLAELDDMAAATAAAESAAATVTAMITPVKYKTYTISADAPTIPSTELGFADTPINIYDEFVIAVYQSGSGQAWSNTDTNVITIRDVLNNGNIGITDMYLKGSGPAVVKLKRLPSSLIVEYVGSGNSTATKSFPRSSEYVDKIRWIAVSAVNSTCKAGATVEAYISRIV